MVTRKVLLSFVFLLSSSVLSAGLTDPKLLWKTVDTPHFSIHYYAGEEEIVSRLTAIVEEAYDRLSKKFDARPWGKTEVVVADNHDLANGFTQVIPYNIILLRVVPPVADSNLADYDDWLRELFIHEYTHVIHISDTRYPAKLLKFLLGKLVAPNGLSPGWVTEGIATYFETSETTRGRGRSSYLDMLLRTDILQGHFLPLDQMAGTHYEWPSWLAQYFYGVGFWNYLAETYGEEKIVEFSHKYGASLWFFSLNNKAKRVFKDEHGRGRSFYLLWRDWKESLEERYAPVKEEIEKRGLVEGEAFLETKKGESLSLPTFSPDGKKIAYQKTSIHHSLQLRLKDLESNEERVLLKKRDIQQISFSPDGTEAVVSNVGIYKKYYHFSDLHEINLETGKVTRLTRGKRARDPDYSPDGKKIAAVLEETGFSILGIYDRESKEWTKVAKADHFDHPRWLYNGKAIVVSAHRGGSRDLWVIDVPSGREKRITSDGALESRPAVAPKEGAIYYASDRGGIANIFRYDLKSGRTRQVTNVLTGAFSPAVSPDGTLLFQYYNGRGFEIRKLRSDFVQGSLGPEQNRGTMSGEFRRPLNEVPSLAGSEVKKYNPFRRLFVPRYLMPNAVLLDNAVFLSATISNHDPIFRHLWYGDVTFRSDNQFVGFGAGYTYNRFAMPFFVGFSDFSVAYGDFFVDVPGTPGDSTDDVLVKDFFEERKRGFIGTTLPLRSHRFSLHYFYENRSDESGLPAGTPLTTLGNYAGIFAQYAVGKTVTSPAAAISTEEGGRFTVNTEVTNSFLGASDTLEQIVVWGDARAYIKVPIGLHHVLALRAAGGTAFGDRLLQRNFGLGGSIGEGPFTGTSTRVFTLRGLPLVSFSGDRAWVASAEYRMPLFRVQRGLGTLPFAMNSAHLAIFGDIGDAFNRGNPSFRPLLGVGGELRADFVLAYHLPVMGRLGYGIILTNRDRIAIAGLTDPYTGADIRNGVLILEIGTSF